MRRRLSEKDKLFKYVEIIEGAARRGSSLTRQLLTFARKTETPVKPVDINTITTETLHLFERSVSKELVVNTSLSTENVTVSGDEGQIQQALLNLLLNSRDAMPNGGTISITTNVTMVDAHTTSRFSAVKPGAFVTITVSDTGIGIDKALQNRVFEPFFTTKDSGTGLGLSVLYGVVQNHGGFVDFESEVGRGTTFRVYLPRALTKIHTSARQRRQRLPRGIENILVIDDEISVCEIARDMLSDLGYTVMTVYDGKAGVETYRIRQASIDLVLLDMNMPLLGGKAAFEQLRSINPGVRIIILTGYGRGVIEPPTFPGEVNGFLQKPFQLEDLATKIRQVLDKRAPATQFTT
jgi:CheY-like chemotaxis protein